MITLEQAKEMFNKLIVEKYPGHTVQKVWEIRFEDPIYVAQVTDDTGKKILPGDGFPSIRKEDGEIIDYEFPTPA